MITIIAWVYEYYSIVDLQTRRASCERIKVTPVSTCRSRAAGPIPRAESLAILDPDLSLSTYSVALRVSIHETKTI